MKRITKQHATAELWKRHRASGGATADRNALVVRYLPLVRVRADVMKARLPNCVDRHDLMSAGVFGLMEAIAQYDPSRGVKFESYAPMRIGGAIVDHLRELDWAPRLCRTRRKTLDAAREAIRNRTGLDPADSELSEELGLSEKEVRRLIADGTARAMSSINAPSKRDGDLEGYRTPTFIEYAASSAPGPHEIVERNDWWARITAGLTRAEKMIVTLYHREGLHMKSIGQTLGLSESRVSQMHSSILARLKAKVVGDEEAWS